MKLLVSIGDKIGKFFRDKQERKPADPVAKIEYKTKDVQKQAEKSKVFYRSYYGYKRSKLPRPVRPLIKQVVL